MSMIRLAIVMVLLLLGTADAQAQGTGSIHRLQRLVSAQHLRQLRSRPQPAPAVIASPAPRSARFPAWSARLTPHSSPGLTRQMTLPLSRSADISVGGRFFGTYGPSVTLRVRLRPNLFP